MLFTLLILCSVVYCWASNKMKLHNKTEFSKKFALVKILGKKIYGIHLLSYIPLIKDKSCLNKFQTAWLFTQQYHCFPLPKHEFINIQNWIWLIPEEPSRYKKPGIVLWVSSAQIILVGFSKQAWLKNQPIQVNVHACYLEIPAIQLQVGLGVLRLDLN